jgi:hypothetical protein
MQPFYMSVENHFFHTSGRSIFFCTYMRQKQFFKYFCCKRFTSKFKHIFIKGHLVGFKLYKKRCLHTLIRMTRTFIYPQFRVLLGNKFSKLNELFCNYKETFYVLVTILTLFYLVVFIYQQFYVMF